MTQTLAIKEHPILFSGEMVRAIIEDRKTQTRRIIKPQPVLVNGCCKWIWGKTGIYVPSPLFLSKAPYQKGDRLWVRETLKLDEVENAWKYKADNSPISYNDSTPNVGAMISWAHHKQGNTCVSIHMPKWASRLKLEIVDVRCEQLQDISEEDAIAEGVGRLKWLAGVYRYQRYSKAKENERILTCLTAIESFKSLWESINGSQSWTDNPWVWAYKFEVIS